MEYLSSFRLTPETFFRSFVSLFKYCDLCNNGPSHQFIFKQVPYLPADRQHFFPGKMGPNGVAAYTQVQAFWHLINMHENSR